MSEKKRNRKGRPRANGSRTPLLRPCQPNVLPTHLLSLIHDHQIMIQSHQALIALVTQLSLQPRYEHVSMPGYHRGRGGVWTKKQSRTRRKRNKKKNAPKGVRVPSPPSSPSSSNPPPQPSPAPFPAQDDHHSAASSFPHSPAQRMGYLRSCLRCRQQDTIKDEDCEWAICRSCNLDGPLSPTCPSPTCGASGHMIPGAKGDLCEMCGEMFHFCNSCRTFCEFSESPCDPYVVLRADRPYSEQLLPKSDLPNNQTRTVLGADDLLGEKRPFEPSSSSPSKKSRADSKSSPSASTHEEPEASSTSPPDSSDAGFTLDNTTLDDFPASYDVSGLDGTPFAWDSKD